MGIRLTTVQFQVGAAKKVSTYPHDLAKSNSSILLLLKTENISLVEQRTAITRIMCKSSSTLGVVVVG